MSGSLYAEAFQRGREALERGDPAGARHHFARAFEAETGSTEAMSWFGVALVLAGADRLRGVALCEQAVRRSADSPPADYLWNLGRAYLEVRYRTQAAQVLRRAASLYPDHRGVHQTLVHMGIRRQPVFPFLRRRNPVNKYLGLLRHRLFAPREEAET